MHRINRSPIAAARVCGFVILAGTLIGAALPSIADSANSETQLDQPPIVSAGPRVDAERVRARFEDRVRRSLAARERLYLQQPATRGSIDPDFLPMAADWLLTEQQPSGGFPFTAGETGTPGNVQAPIIAGLLRAWRRTQISAYLDAAEAAGLWLVDNQNRFDASNGSRRFTGADAFMFQELSRATGDAQFAQLAESEFWGPLAAGTYGPDGDWGIDEFIQAEFDRRVNFGEVVAWDLAWAAAAAFEAGETAFLDAINTGIETSLEFNTIDGGRTFDLVGLSGAVWAGARTGAALDPQTGLFADADSTLDLALELTTYQDADTGGFFFNTTLAMMPGDATALDTQVTAFALLGLDLLDRDAFDAEIQAAGGFLVDQQLASGQIVPYPGADPNGLGTVETHAESMAGFATAALRPDVIRSVAETSDVPTAADNDYTRINNAIQTALDDDVLVLEGTFDWSEPNAIASWDAGGWWSLWPQGVNRVTIRPASPDAATISGPGDLPQFDLEGVFGAVGENTGWEVSGLRFENIDNAIGMFFFSGGFSPPGVNQFDDTRIVENHIVLPTDLDAAGEELQNIAIHYSRGDNQLIAGNTIEIPGDGVSNPLTAQFSKNVGMQSNSGSNAFDGLVIENNIVRVLNAPSAEPAEIIGIWENGGASGGNLSVRDNVFDNLDPANDPAVNLQEGFRIHSQVTRWEGNSVSGARYGIRWLPDDQFTVDFSGRPPVPVISNFIRNNATGVSIESNGAGDFKCNVITGNAVGIANNTAIDRPSDATINWWGCNDGPGAAGCDTAPDGSVDAGNWLIFALTADPTTIPIISTSALEASLIGTVEGGSSIFNGNCVVPDGLSVDFDGGVLGNAAPAATALTAGLAGATFTPSATGIADDVSATLEGDQQAVTTIEITEAPQIAVTPAVTDFGDVEVGDTAGPLLTTIDNVGSVDLNVEAVQPVDPPFFRTTDGTCPDSPFMLAPGAGCTLAHEFAPGMTGSQSQGVAVTSDAEGSPDSFVLTGTGIMPEVALNPFSLDFGNQVVDETSDRLAATVTNNGATPLEFTGVAVGGADAGDFELIDNGCVPGLILSPGLSCGFEVEFTPSATGARTASVDILTNAASSPDVLPLSGTGILAVADLSVAIDSDPNFAGITAPFEFTVTAENLGPLDATGATVQTVLDPGLANVTWTCSASAGASCPASGTGSLDEPVDLPAGAQAVFTLSADLIDGGPDETIVNTATIDAPAEPPDPNPDNNDDELTTSTGLFADGFE
jgi:uncharacterized repeat protein (TIGR01451 family)